MFSFIVTFGPQSLSSSPMWIPMNTTQIKACDQDVNIVTQKKRRGVYWSYEHLNQFYGPFRSSEQAIADARTYSRYGTTNKKLIPST